MDVQAANRIGAHAFRYLATKPRSGQIISRFRRGFNVLFGEQSDPGFVSIQAEGVPLHPWAVACELAGRIRVGDLVVAEADRIRFREGDDVVDVSAAAVDELRIKPHASEEGERALSRLPILKKILAEERAKQDPDPFRSEIDGILNRWKKTGNFSMLLGLVGLGPGSTPSGDDVLVGMLAGFTAFERISNEVKTPLLGLRAALRATETPRTSLPSAQMLAAAGDGSVPEPVLALLSALASEFDRDVWKPTRSLVAQGATSGIETLAGLLQALDFGTSPGRPRPKIGWLDS